VEISCTHTLPWETWSLLQNILNQLVVFCGFFFFPHFIHSLKSYTYSHSNKISWRQWCPGIKDIPTWKIHHENKKIHCWAPGICTHGVLSDIKFSTRCRHWEHPVPAEICNHLYYPLLYVSQVLPSMSFLLRKCQDNVAAMRDGQIESFHLYSQTHPPSRTLAALSLLYRPGHLTQPGQVMLNSLMVTSEPNKEYGRREKWRTHWLFTASEISVLQCYLGLFNYLYDEEWTAGTFRSTCFFLTWNVRSSLCCLLNVEWIYAALSLRVINMPASQWTRDKLLHLYYICQIKISWFWFWAGTSQMVKSEQDGAE